MRGLLVVLLLTAGRFAGAQGASQLLVGDVVSRESGSPLGHAMVTVLGAERQTFTTEAGAFAFRSLEPGKYRLRATRIGYVPAELIVEVPPASAPPRVRIELVRLSIQLGTVKVIAVSLCTAPGRPDPAVNADFAAIIQQVRLNAEHYQLLSDSFPFTYQMERAHRQMRKDSSRGPPSYDTTSLRSDHVGWEYELGRMVEREANGSWTMHLPSLRDFAGYAFLNNHCFRYAGLDSTRDGMLLRIDFRADVQIRTPDVHGSIFLDARTYQIRRAILELSRIPPELTEVTAAKVVTEFGEISPAISVIRAVNGIASRHHSWLPWSTVAETEDQRMFNLQWLKVNPARP